MTVRFTCGVDIGARAVKAAILNIATLEFAADGLTQSGSRPQDAARELVERLSKSVPGLLWPDYVLATGYGRRNCLFADSSTTEITCHARGVRLLHPEARTVIDIGGQDSKAIILGVDGGVEDFAMNDRCAAGTGMFFEMACNLLGLGLPEGCALAAESKDVAEISSMCAVFAETEMVSLTQSGFPPAAVLAGVCRAIAKRTIALLGSRPAADPIVFTGGVALNAGVVKALGLEMPRPILVPAKPQFTGAYGAALLAAKAGSR